MRIGIDVSQIVHRGTGVSTYTSQLVKALLASDSIDDFVLFGSSLRNRRPLIDYVDQLVKRPETAFAFLPPIALEYLWNYLHVVPIETFCRSVSVFHTSDWLEPPAGCPKVTTIHDLAIYKYPETFVARGGHDIVANLKRKLRFVKQDHDLIIAVSQNTKSDVINILRIPEERIRVVYEASDPIYTPSPDKDITQVKNKYGITGPYFLCVGTREPRKNIDKVITAFNRIDPKDYQLIIAGKYGWGNDVKPETNTNVRVLGFVPTHDLVALYSGATALVYPSLYEGFGLPILDAMSCGCPVITSNIGAMKEIAGNSALLINPLNDEEIATAMESLTQSKKTIEDIKTKGLARSKQFSWDKAAKDTLNVYREAAEY